MRTYFWFLKWTKIAWLCPFKQILPTTTTRNLWRPVRRIYMLILGLRGLSLSQKRTRVDQNLVRLETLLRSRWFDLAGVQRVWKCSNFHWKICKLRIVALVWLETLMPSQRLVCARRVWICSKFIAIDESLKLLLLFGLYLFYKTLIWHWCAPAECKLSSTLVLIWLASLVDYEHLLLLGDRPAWERCESARKLGGAWKRDARGEPA